VSEEIARTEIGEASALSMDEFMRIVVGQMFENDNDTSKLEVVLKGTDSAEPPKLEFEMRLISINGVKTRSQ
jgi:hypothetical protein